MKRKNDFTFLNICYNKDRNTEKHSHEKLFYFFRNDRLFKFLRVDKFNAKCVTYDTIGDMNLSFVQSIR